jgi:hypothetical protein
MPGGWRFLEVPIRGTIAAAAGKILGPGTNYCRPYSLTDSMHRTPAYFPLATRRNCATWCFSRANCPHRLLWILLYGFKLPLVHFEANHTQAVASDARHRWRLTIQEQLDLRS